MGLTLRDSIHLVTDPENLDASVREVFGTMLGIQCSSMDDISFPSASGDSVTAVVGFGGILSGACVLHCDALTARHIAECMTAMEFDCVDETVKDGMGEICNMLAGAWKSRIPETATHCALSVPAVISGKDYRVHVQAPEFRLQRAYSFEGVQFDLTIICDGLR
jgi:chemotaxis protein CheX